jgi:hypothetical protein
MLTVNSLEAIENLLRRGLTPVTENRDALLDLGFARAYPHIASGYEATIWERAVEYGRRAADGSLLLVRQRAILTRGADDGVFEFKRRHVAENAAMLLVSTEINGVPAIPGRRR